MEPGAGSEGSYCAPSSVMLCSHPRGLQSDRRRTARRWRKTASHVLSSVRYAARGHNGTRSLHGNRRLGCVSGRRRL